MTAQADPHLTAELARLPVAQRALVVGGTPADSGWLTELGWEVTTVEGDLTDWSPEAGSYGLVVSLRTPVTGSTEEFVARLGEAVRSGGTLFVVGHLAPGENQISSDDAIAALSEDPWDIYVAEERERTTEDGVDSVFHAEKS